MKSLAFATIAELKAQLEKKEISPSDIIDFFTARFAQHDQQLGSALEIFEKDSILKSATCSGPLAGIPGLVKDNICQKGRIASCASRLLSTYRAPYDATAVERLKQDGALIIGRANCDEFAMGSSGETSAYKKTLNPWDASRVPGGSSSGSIAAVAAGLVPWALGSETGGSVRQPAAFCGIVGLKPTYGLVSRYGLVAYASSLDQIGLATRTVYDNALVFSSYAGHDLNDSSSLHVDKKDYTQMLDGKLPEGLTIGVIDNALHAEGMESEVAQLIENGIKQFEALGAKVKRVTVPSMDYGAAVYFILSRAEAASNLARFDGVRYGVRSDESHSLRELYEYSRGQGFGAEVRARIMIGNYVLSAGHADEFYSNAKKVQRLMRKEFIQSFKDVDVLLSPVHAAPAFKFGAFEQNKLAMDLQDYFTCPANISGIPAISIPCGFVGEQLPVGFQLMGPDLSEELLFKVAHAYEQATPWHTMHPTGF